MLIYFLFPVVKCLKRWTAYQEVQVLAQDFLIQVHLALTQKLELQRRGKPLCRLEGTLSHQSQGDLV